MSESDLKRIDAASKTQTHRMRGINVEFDLKYIKKIYEVCFKTGYQFSLKAGVHTARIAERSIKSCVRGIKNISRKPLALIKYKIDKMAVAIKNRHDVIVHPAERFLYGARMISVKMRKPEEFGYGSGYEAFIGTLKLGTVNNKRILKRVLATVLNYTMPFAAVIGFVMLVQYASGLTYAINVNYNNKDIGYISTEAVFESAEQKLKQRIIYVSGDQAIESKVFFQMKIVDESDLKEDEQLVNEMISMSEDDISEAYGLYIDDNFYGATLSPDVITDTVEHILQINKQKNKDAKIEIEQIIVEKQGLYMTSGIMEPQEIVDLLTSDVEGQKVYIIKDGDTPESIAKKNNISIKELEKLNPGINDKYIYPEDEVLISQSRPFLTVKVTKEIEYTVKVPYTKTEIKDTTQWKGWSKTSQKGEYGESKIRAKVVYTNGIEESREILSTVVLKKPVDEKTVVGVKVPDSHTVLPTSTGSGSVSGINFAWPVGGGYISQYFRGRGHTGIDIAAPRGTPIYASAAGVVTMSGTYASYGKCIIIDHGNGVTTLYAHNSALYVKPGTRVERGQHISAVGATGRAYGNHLHFEIRSNGSLLNPANYVGK